jgi:hypothetical protein
MIAAKLRRLDEERRPSPWQGQHREKIHAIRTAAPDLAAALPADATHLQVDQALLDALDRVVAKRGGGQ